MEVFSLTHRSRESSRICEEASVNCTSMHSSMTTACKKSWVLLSAFRILCEGLLLASQREGIWSSVVSTLPPRRSGDLRRDARLTKVQHTYYTDRGTVPASTHIDATSEPNQDLDSLPSDVGSSISEERNLKKGGRATMS